MSAVAGDPASCSRLGGTLRQLATQLRTTGRASRAALEHERDLDHQLDVHDPERQRLRPVLTRARRRFDALDEATLSAAREVDRVGAALQAHSADLAEAVADSRRIADRAAQARLRVSDAGVVASAWGVSGIADGQASAEQLAALDRLQSELDTVAALVAQRRQRLVATLRESQVVLATHAGALRR